jgi:hypothetical protein
MVLRFIMLLITSVFTALLLIFGFLWITGAILRRLGISRNRTASEERALADVQRHSNINFPN